MAEPIRVLHVDDEPGFADLAAEFLVREDDRFVVETATSTSEALDALAAGAFDCVVSDYEMPELNGIEFLEAVRERYPDLPFILYTGKGSEEVASAAISAGVTDYLQKQPGSDHFALLANRVSNAVRQFRTERVAERTKRQLSELSDNTDDVLWMFTGDWSDLLFVNSAYEDIWGRSKAALEADARDFLGGVHPEDRERVEAAIQRLSDGGSVDLEFRVNEAESYGRWVWVQGEPIVEDGEVVRVAGFARDVTDRKADERDLRETERQYRAIFEDPNILVGLVDVDGTVRDVNQTAIEYIDGGRESVVGEPFWETPWFDHSEAVRADVAEWVERAADGEYVEFELDLVRPSGEPYTVQGVFRPVTDEAGEVVSLVVSDREITERKRREVELQRTNAVLSTLVDTLPVGVIAEDASRNVLAVNQRLLDVFGRDEDPEDLVGANTEQMASVVSDQFEDPAGFVERTSALVTDREPVQSETWALADGRTVERSHHPIELPDGHGHLWTYRDVTERVDHERRLQALSETTRELMAADSREEVAEIGATAAREVLGLDANGIHLYDADADALVPAAITEPARDIIGDPPTFTEGDAIAWRVYERGDPLAVDDVRAEPDVYRQDTPVRSELFLPLGEHGVLAAGSTETEAFDQQDLALGEVLAGNVVTAFEQVQQTAQLRARERELSAQNDRLSEFASVVSHDLRNPLNVAEGRLTLARETGDTDHLEEVADAHERMQALIDDLLALTRDGTDATDLAAIDLDSVVADCWATVDTGDATLVADTAASIRGDESRVRQLFENLFRNAVEHAGGGVTVTVGALDDGFYVEDDGPGIPESEREHVFDYGYSSTDDGTGFGLSIVEQVADAHGWTVRVTESDDGGARFEVAGVETGDRQPTQR